MVMCYIHQSGILHGVRKIILSVVTRVKMRNYNFEGQRLQNRPREPKTEFGAQNRYGRVMYPSIGNFTWSKNKYTFGGQKGENRPPEPKNGIWGPKSI
jgi:hypothetical protein